MIAYAIAVWWWSYHHADLPAPALMKCHNYKEVQWLAGTEQAFRGPDGTLNGISNLEIAIAIRWTPHFRTARAGDDKPEGVGPSPLRPALHAFEHSLRELGRATSRD